MKKKYLLVSALALLTSLPDATAQSKKVLLTTEGATGTEITLVVNASSQTITIDWGDGEKKSYNATGGDLLEITGMKQGDVITIEGGSTWYLLDCSAQGITSIDLSEAKSLRSLYARDNSLTTLDLSGMNALTDLSVAGNKIESITYTNATYPEHDLTAIECIDLSGNRLSGAFVVREQGADATHHLQHVNLSGNLFDKAFLTTNTALSTFKCDENRFAKLDLSKCTGISTLLLHDNTLTSLQLPAGAPHMQQMLADGNSLSGSIDLSQSTKLKDISVAGNNLSEVKMPDTKLLTLNFADNSLTLASLPRYAPQYVTFRPQSAIDISQYPNMKQKDGMSYMELVVWADRNVAPLSLAELTKIGTSGGGKGQIDGIISFFTVDESGNAIELKKGTSSTAPSDYSATSNKFSFFTPMEKVYARINGYRVYKDHDVYVETTAFAVKESQVTAIENIGSDEAPFTIIATKGHITMSNNGTPRSVAVYTADGKMAWSGMVDTGTRTIILPRGIYIVDGKKIVL